MAKSSPDALSQGIASTKGELNVQFNNLISTILNDLPSESPQYTGFLLLVGKLILTDLYQMKKELLRGHK